MNVLKDISERTYVRTYVRTHARDSLRLKRLRRETNKRLRRETKNVLQTAILSQIRHFKSFLVQKY